MDKRGCFLRRTLNAGGRKSPVVRRRVGQMPAWGLLLLMLAPLGLSLPMKGTPPIVQSERKLFLRTVNSYPESEEESEHLFQLPRVQIIFPGTKWCGHGNISKEENELGYFKESDKCCKDHDNCPDSIQSGETKHGLHNNASITRLNCDCDLKFYDCLKTLKSIVSTKIGFTYFNVLWTQCYRKDYPIIQCIKYSGIIHRRCVVYELEASKPPIWQWFDVPAY